MIKNILVILIFLNILCCPVKADEFIEGQYNSSGAKELYSISSDVFPEFDSTKIVSDLSNGKGFDTTGIIKKVVEFFVRQLVVSVKLCIVILAVGFITGLVNTLQQSFESKGVSQAGFIVSYCVFAGILVAGFGAVIQPAKEAVEALCVMIKASLPMLISMITLSGGVITSSLMNSILISMISIISEITQKIIFPLIVGSVGLAVADNMSGKINIKHTIATMKQIAKWIMVFCMAVYTGFFSIYGITGSALDSSVGKAARFAIGSGIPVVGGVVSDSIEAVMGTVGAVRNITGTVGIIVIIVTALSPIIKTAASLWIFRICCVALEPVSDKRVTELTANVTDSIGLVLAVLLCVCILFVGCIGIILMTGNFIR